ncbi:DUF4969 domain-containing protein [Glaciibacter psychrotolerans]
MVALISASIIISPAVVAPASAAPVVVSQVAKNGTKGYLLVDGKPFTMSGVQSFGEWQTFGNDSMSPIPTNQNTRILSQDWLENTFEKTAAAGFSTIQIELAWNQIEPTTPGVYDWTLIDKYVAWAKKYNLKMDFVWWGANGCGGGVLPNSAHGFMTSIPVYLQNQSKYWGNGGNGEEVFPYLPIVGNAHYADANYLFASERTAVTAMFNHLADYDTTHQTILFQVYNEPNLTNTWGSQTALWLSLIDQLGAAVKNSNYIVATRVNFAGSRLPNGSIGALANIDFAGPDYYSWNVTDIAKAVVDTATKSDIAYIPETFSNNSYLTSIAATALVNGGFVDFWQLNNGWAGRNYSFFGHPSEGYPSYTTWTLGTMPTLPEGVSRMNSFNTGVNKMTQLVAQALPADMRGFNIGTNVPSTSYNGSATLNNTTVTFSTPDGSIGLALYDAVSNSHYLVSDTRTSATYNLGSSTATASMGSFDAAGTWVSQGSRSVASTGNIQINPGELIKVSAPSGTNLALNHPASATSSYSGQAASNAVDGNIATQWTAGTGTFPQSLTVDLGGVRALATVKQRFAETDSSTYKYRVEGSTDNSTWTTLVDMTAAGVLTNSAVTASVSGSYRYVKLTVTAIDHGHWANSKEFEVLG